MAEAKAKKIYPFEGGDNKDLPKGAVNVTSEHQDLLTSLRNRAVEFRDYTQGHLGYGITFTNLLKKNLSKDTNMIESGRKHMDGGYYTATEEDRELFNGRLHPTIDGYRWYRGLCFPTSEGKVFIYTPWRATEEEKKRTDTVYILAEVKPEEVESIIKMYVERQLDCMDKKEKELREGIERDINRRKKNLQKEIERAGLEDKF